jgi:hypothetical protein
MEKSPAGTSVIRYDPSAIVLEARENGASAQPRFSSGLGQSAIGAFARGLLDL